jgi:lactoylglutathione lyase
MKIEHLAIWANDLEKMKSFYEQYFDAVATEKYTNKATGFTSYFLSFKAGTRLEIMNRADVHTAEKHYDAQHTGLVHFAFSMDSREAVDEMTERLRNDGYKIVGEPRVTGDGYYESVLLDPEKNIVELVA